VNPTWKYVLPEDLWFYASPLAQVQVLMTSDVPSPTGAPYLLLYEVAVLSRAVGKDERIIILHGGSTLKEDDEHIVGYMVYIP
jgi:hypothetical protein